MVKEDTLDQSQLKHYSLHRMSKEDSLFIQKEIAELNSEYYKERVDSMGGWKTGKIFTPLGNNFRIYSYTGDWMGAYPVPMNKVVIEVIAHHKTIDTSIYPIYKVRQISKHKYLLLGNGFKRESGWQGYDEGYEAHILTTIPFKFETIVNQVEMPGIVELSDGAKLKDVYIHWDLDTKTLKTGGYSYNPETLHSDSLECHYDEQTFIYKNDSFQLIKSRSSKENRVYN
jgi:hypothetical protein